MRCARFAVIGVAPRVEVGGRAVVERLIARQPQLVRGEQIAERRDTRHPLGVVTERCIHRRILAGHQRILDSAHGAHRRKQRIGALVHHLRHVAQIRLGDAIDARLVPGAVDHHRRMPPRKRDDGGELGLRHEVGRFDVHDHAQLVRRLQILHRRHERMETHKVEAQLFALRGDHAVVVEVARKVKRLREVAVLGDSAQVDRLAVQAKLLAFGNEPPYAELLPIDGCFASC